MTEALPRRQSDLLNGEIGVLTVRDLGELQIGWNARYTRHDIEHLALTKPGLSLWHRRTGGYLIATPWRHRDDIANVLDISGASTADDLLRAFIERCAQLDFSLAVVAEYVERRRESFYYSAGMNVLEDIVVYELGGISPRGGRSRAGSDLQMREISLDDRTAVDELLDLDHRAFPWLWWNSEAEFHNYADVPGVSIEGAYDVSGTLIGYIGTTSLGSWGHLDRIAVDPALQGRGLGRWLLDYSITSLSARGARRVALSTQSSNTTSRALYESAGFRRSRSHDYRIYGRRLRHDGDGLSLGVKGDE